MVRNKALAAGAGQWICDLPELAADLEREWSIAIGPAYDDATEAFVAEATLSDGTPAVLKLHIPRPGDHAGKEITVLRLARGQGCARLLRADAARGALLLERLGPSLHQLKDPIELLQGDDPHQRARWLAARCNLDATAIWQWGVLERVATGLLLTKIELQPVGRQMLTAADHVAR